MQLKSLRIFMTVARAGSFVAAAEQLHTVQSNVTAHIKKLERELQTRLIDRGGRFRLTPAGRLLLTHAERVLSAHDDAVEAFRHSGKPAGRLRVGAMETTAAVRLPGLLTRFHQACPEVDMELVTGPTAQHIDQLLEGRIDCAFVAGKVPHDDLHMREAFSERLVLVSPEPLTSMPPPEALVSATFLAFRQGCSYRQRIELLLASHGITGGRIFEFGTLDAILGCVAAGMGYTVLPRSVVDAHLSRFTVHSIALPDSMAHMVTYLAALHLDGWSPALSAFIGTVSEQPKE